MLCYRAERFHETIDSTRLLNNVIRGIGLRLHLLPRLKGCPVRLISSAVHPAIVEGAGQCGNSTAAMLVRFSLCWPDRHCGVDSGENIRFYERTSMLKEG